MSDTKHYVCVLPDGKEVNVEKKAYQWSNQRENPKEAAESAVRTAGLTTARKDPKYVNVRVFSLGIQDGALKRFPVGNYSVMPPLTRMTEDEYRAEMDAILGDLPEPFRSFVEAQCWDDGHSSGYEEVVNLAGHMAARLGEAVKAYQASLGRTH